MSANRLADFFTEHRSARFSFEIAARRPTPAPQQAFVACPAALIPAGHPTQVSSQMSIYRLAYEQAQAAVAARRLTRESASPWN